VPHSSYISTYRLDNYSPRLHLSVYRPAVACSGTLISTPSNPTVVLAVSFDVGDETDVRAGFLIRIRDTATQKVKGYTRVRYTGTPTSASIPVRELSFAHVACVSGDTFECLRYVPLDTKLTTADATFSPDGIPYGAQGSNPPPLTCSGGNSVGWVDAGETFRTIPTDGSNTTLVDPDSVTPPTDFWVNDSGTAFASGSANTDASPVIEADVGSWLLQHNSTDPDNGQGANPQYTHHVVHDEDSPPYECILTDYSGDHENGVNWSVEVLDEGVTSEDVFELALCFLWVDDVFSHTGVQDLHRSEVTGRSHIIGMGYARRVTTSMDGEDGVERLTFDIQSPLARLQEIASYSKVMLENASPDDWNDVKTLGFKRGITQLWQFYTTGSEAGYDLVYDASFEDARYPAHFIPRTDPIVQMRELIDARQGRLVQREWGARFEVQYHPALLPLADRSSTDITLTSDDVLNFEFSTELADSIELFQQEGITAGASGNVSTFSRIGIGGGKNAETLPRKSPDNQAQNNDWTGMSYASRENVYQDEDGIKHRVGELTLRCYGQYMVLDFAPDYVAFNFVGGYVDFAAFRFWLKRFTWDVDAETGEAITTFTFQCETAARPGVTYVPLPDSNTPPSDYPPTPPVTPPTGFPGSIDRTQADMALIAINGVFLTADFQTPAASGGPTWAFDTAPWSGTLLQWVPDGFSNPAAGWIVTSDEIGYYVFETGSYTVKHTNTPGLFYASADASFAENGFFALTYYDTSDGSGCIHSADNTTFTKTIINADTGMAPSGQPLGCYVSSKTPGRIVSGAFTASSVSVAYVSNDHGASWAALSPAFFASVDGFAHIMVPWAVPNDATYFYTIFIDFMSGDAIRLYRQMAGSNVDITPPAIGGFTYGPNATRNVCETSAQNPNRLLFVGQRYGGGFALFLSNNALSAAPTYTVVAAPGTDFRRCAISGNDPNRAWAWGVNNAISQLTITGSTVTLDDRSGNLASVGPGEIIGIAGV
jgi:hypothetical protein